MYGIPDDLDTAMFVGRTLASIDSYPHSVHLHFDGPGQLTVTIEGSYEHAGESHGKWRDAVTLDGSPSPPVSRLTRLTGKVVTHAQVENPKSLLLTFEDGQTLRLLDDTPQYESFQIETDARLWVI